MKQHQESQKSYYIVIYTYTQKCINYVYFLCNFNLELLIHGKRVLYHYKQKLTQILLVIVMHTRQQYSASDFITFAVKVELYSFVIDF